MPGWPEEAPRRDLDLLYEEARISGTAPVWVSRTPCCWRCLVTVGAHAGVPVVASGGQIEIGWQRQWISVDKAWRSSSKYTLALTSDPVLLSRMSKRPERRGTSRRRLRGAADGRSPSRLRPGRAGSPHVWQQEPSRNSASNTDPGSGFDAADPPGGVIRCFSKQVPPEFPAAGIRSFRWPRVPASWQCRSWPACSWR